MTLTDVIIRDLNLHKREKLVAERSDKEYEREIRRRLWRRRARVLKEILVAVMFALLGFMWIFS